MLTFLFSGFTRIQAAVERMAASWERMADMSENVENQLRAKVGFEDTKPALPAPETPRKRKVS